MVPIIFFFWNLCSTSTSPGPGLEVQGHSGKGTLLPASSSQPRETRRSHIRKRKITRTSSSHPLLPQLESKEHRKPTDPFISWLASQDANLYPRTCLCGCSCSEVPLRKGIILCCHKNLCGFILEKDPCHRDWAK